MRQMTRWMLYTAGAALVAISPTLAHAQDSTGSGSAAPPQPATGHRVGGGGGGGGRMGGGERMTDRLFNGITLTGAQRDSIDKLSAAHAAQTRQAWQSRQGGGGPPDSAARAQMQADRAQYLATLRAVLTPDQQPAFDKNVADMQSQMGRRGGGGGGNP